MLVVNTPLSRAYSSYKQKKLDKQAEIKAKRAEEMALHQMELETREKERAKFLKEQEKTPERTLEIRKSKV